MHKYAILCIIIPCFLYSQILCLPLLKFINSEHRLCLKKDYHIAVGSS
jgi:hypothetical protein